MDKINIYDSGSMHTNATNWTQTNQYTQTLCIHHTLTEKNMPKAPHTYGKMYQHWQ